MTTDGSTKVDLKESLDSYPATRGRFTSVDRPLFV